MYVVKMSQSNFDFLNVNYTFSKQVLTHDSQ